MTKKEIIKEIEDWVKSYEKLAKKNYHENMGDDAFILLKEVLKELNKK